MGTRIKRIGILVLVFLLGIGIFAIREKSPVYAMQASDFTDVVSNYWGYPYIDFSASNGIINGYQAYDGTYQFLPEKSVSKEESVTMLYRALSATGNLKSDKDYTADYAELFTKNKIAGWAQKFVAYGLKYELITEDEIGDFTDDNGRGTPAPREQIALWTAKALGRNLSPAYSLVYVDKDSISAKNLPYIDLLYRHGIMRGDDKKMFHPASGIKRAEFAAICKRVYESANTDTYSESKEIQSYRGAITAVDSYNCKIMMTQSEGTARVIQINAKTQIVINGKVNYNGLSGITIGSTAVVAWGAFHDPDQSNSGEVVLQLHIITKIQTQTGLLSDIEKVDNETSILKIENEDGDMIHYILDQNSQTGETPKKGTEVIFIADGIKILEMK